tara:strand:- start:1853 stop:2062 length:210 start_codon:yes stop_codon:yes gene_type:complete
MIDKIDILALSKEVDRDSKSGALSEELLLKGETLYGVNTDFPDYIERKTPDGSVELGSWIDNEFVVKIC